MSLRDRSPSVLRRLLTEISWEGTTTQYRSGGEGFENVLTAEVFQALDLLPRTEFLGGVVAALHGDDIEGTRSRVLMEIEGAEVDLLPGSLPRGRGDPDYDVQPDATLSTSGAFVLLEAKRLRRSSFQAHQLPREFVAVHRYAEGRAPLLLLVLPKPPPVSVAGHGSLSIREAIQLNFGTKSGAHATYEQVARLTDTIASSTAWITWSEIQDVVRRQASAFPSGTQSIAGCVSRLAALVEHAVVFHGERPRPKT